MISASCEFLGRTKYGRIKAVFPANALDEWTPDGVRNVLPVPGKQKTKSMICGGRYVQCVCLGFCGKRSSKDEMLGQRFDFRCNGDDGNALQPLQASGRCDRVSSAGFPEHQGRHVQGKVIALRCPPLVGNLLVSRRNDIATGARHQIADDARFDVDCLHGVLTLPRLAAAFRSHHPAR